MPAMGIFPSPTATWLSRFVRSVRSFACMSCRRGPASNTAFTGSVPVRTVCPMSMQRPVREVLLDARVGILVERDRAATDDLEACVVDLLADGRELIGRLLVGDVHRLEVDVGRPQGLRHLECLLERELAQRVARDAELDLVHRRQCRAAILIVRRGRGGTPQRGRGGDTERGAGDGRGSGGEEGAAWNALFGHGASPVTGWWGQVEFACTRRPTCRSHLFLERTI